MKKASHISRKNNYYVMMVIIPIILLTLLILFYPMISVFYYSVFDYNLMISGDIVFSGIHNFLRMFSDPAFYNALGVSLVWVLLNLALQMTIGMLVALLISKDFRGRGAIRTAILSPYAVSGVIASTLWLFMFQDSFGLINDILKRIGLISSPISWLSNPSLAIFAVVIAEVWRYTPFFIIIFSAALQSVPQDLYEAAKIDGAGALKRFGRITLPLIKETVVMTCILRIVWEFNSVDVIYTLTKGGPINSTTTMAMYIVKTAINGSDMGYGSALTVVSFILLAAFSLLLMRSTGVKLEEGLL